MWRLCRFRRPWAPGRFLNYLFGGYPTYFPVNFRSLANYHFFREFSIFEGNEWKRKKVSHLNIPKEISLPARWRQITAVKLLTVTQSNLSGWNVTQLSFKDLPLFGVQAWSQRLVTFDWWQIVITRKVVGIRGVSIFFAIFETPLKPKAWFWYACGDVFVIQVCTSWYEKTAWRIISTWHRPSSLLVDLSCLWYICFKREHRYSCRGTFYTTLHIVWGESIRWFRWDEHFRSAIFNSEKYFKSL